MNLNELYLSLPAIIFFASALIILTVNFIWRSNLAIIEMISYLTPLAVIVVLINQLQANNIGDAFYKSLIIDKFAQAMSIIISISVILSILLVKSMGNVRHAEFCATVMMIAGGLIILMTAKEFITLFLAIELVSIGSYIITGFTRSVPASNEAQVKYFVLGSFATAIMLYGIALVYGSAGTIEFTLRSNFHSIGLVGIILIAIGFCFKIGAVPFHMWVPDVYEGAPVAAVAFMSVAVKAAAFTAFIRVAEIFFSYHSAISMIIYSITILTMLIGNILAIRQSSVKRMLAYSSIAHTGYTLIGISILCSRPELANSVHSIMFYLLTYTFMTLGAFAFLNLVEGDKYEDLAGMAKARPVVSLSMTILMLSLAGFPPTAGFFAKFYIFKASIDAGNLILPLVGAVSTIISIYYYLKVVVMMYMKPLPEDKSFPNEPYTELCVGLCVAFIVVIGLLPNNYLVFIFRST